MNTNVQNGRTSLTAIRLGGAGYLVTALGLFVCGFVVAASAATNDLPAVTNTVATAAPALAGATSLTLPERPLSLLECVNIALQQNAQILKSKDELDAAYGVAVQLRAVALPKAQITGQYSYTDQLEKMRFENVELSFQKENSWNTGVQLVQSIYEGGRMRSALRSAKLTREQALYQHQTIVMDMLTLIQIAYYDVLLAEQQIVVEGASVKLLEKELEDSTRRFNAGTVPRFNVLRAEVEVANAKPKLFRARNQFRISKNYLAKGLGYRIPSGVWEDIPLQLSGKLDAEPYDVQLPTALAEALEKRPELGMARKTEALAFENVKVAKSGYQPTVQLFGGYGSRNASFQEDISASVNGWNAGAQLTWNIFDGFLTKGRVDESKARLSGARTELDDRVRQIELEVRTAYSSFVEAREVLESQKKVQEQAEEALRLAKAREEAGTGTQLDVLNAQTSLTQARTTQIQALRDYAVAKARMERAIGRGGPIAAK